MKRGASDKVIISNEVEELWQGELTGDLPIGVPAAALAVLILSIVPFVDQVRTPGPVAGVERSGGVVSVTEEELVSAVFESDLSGESFVFDVFAGGFLTLEDSA
jgi:hypothetical protein